MKNGKSYIGKTYQCIYERIRGHLKDANIHKERPLYKAFNKYGLDYFSLEILGEFPKGVLEEKEVEYIKMYDSYGRGGYNATLGGDGAITLELDAPTILSDYERLKNQTSVAKLHNCSQHTVRRVLDKYNATIYDSMKEFNKLKRRSIYSPTLDQEFNYSTDCAQYLIDNNIAKSPNVSSVSAGVRKACLKIRPSYLGHTFEYLS